MHERNTEAHTQTDVHAFQRHLIAEFRAQQGRLSGMFEGWSLAVLTTVGARTRKQRESILGYLEFDGNGIVVASANGADRHPDWYHNIRSNPIVTVESGTDTYRAIAATPGGDERARLFERVVAEAPGYADHQAKTARELPVVVLHRIGPRLGEEPVRGMGDWLVEVHAWLRGELAHLQRQVEHAVAGEADSPDSGRDLVQQLREHCLSFCGALRRHHGGEDATLFPSLAAQFPALAPALAQLGEEHKEVAALQDAIQKQIEEFVPGETDPAELRTELADLMGKLEAHFTFEEETVVTALNATAAAPDIG